MPTVPERTVAGVGQGSLYRHFPDRMSLALAAFEDNVTELAHLAAGGHYPRRPARPHHRWDHRIGRLCRDRHRRRQRRRPARPSDRPSLRRTWGRGPRRTATRRREARHHERRCTARHRHGCRLRREDAPRPAPRGSRLLLVLATQRADPRPRRSYPTVSDSSQTPVGERIIALGCPSRPDHSL